VQVLTPYIPYLIRRWQESGADSAQLWRALQVLGDIHSPWTVGRVITRLRRASDAGLPPETQGSPYTCPQGPSARVVSFILVCPAATRSAEAQTYLVQLCQMHPGIVRARWGDELEAWRAAAMHSGIRVHDAAGRPGRARRRTRSAETGDRGPGWEPGAAGRDRGAGGPPPPHQAHRPVALQGRPAGVGQHAARQMRTQDGACGRTHGPLAAEEEASMDGRRVVQAIVSEEEGAGQGADCPEMLPVACAPCTAGERLQRRA
jgi:hypothetical protein